MRRLLGEEEGCQIIRLPNTGIDFGNYKRGNLAFAMGALLAAAREFGDAELADAAIATLNLRSNRVERDGVVHYRGGSNLANLYIAAARFMRRGDYRTVFTNKPSTSQLNGPLLTEATYPDVLVARAVSHGEDLDLVLVPGSRRCDEQVLRFSRLVPGRQYAVDGRPELTFSADERGEARMKVTLSQRTRLQITPHP
jgi:hypothetical protein